MDPVALREDERAHLGIPAACLVAEVDSGLEQLPHRNGRHGEDLLVRLCSAADLVAGRPASGAVASLPAPPRSERSACDLRRPVRGAGGALMAGVARCGSGPGGVYHCLASGEAVRLPRPNRTGSPGFHGKCSPEAGLGLHSRPRVLKGPPRGPTSGRRHAGGEKSRTERPGRSGSAGGRLDERRTRDSGTTRVAPRLPTMCSPAGLAPESGLPGTSWPRNLLQRGRSEATRRSC